MFQSQNQQQRKQLEYALQERLGREHQQDCPSVTDGNQPFEQLVILRCTLVSDASWVSEGILSFSSSLST